MRTITMNGKHARVFGEIYNSPREIVDIVGARPHVFDDDDDFFSPGAICNSPSWNGWTTHEELIEDCLSCKTRKDIIEGIKAGIKPSIEGVKVRNFANVQGFAPIVPNALMGLPNSMMDQRRVTVKAKVINLFVNISTLGGSSAYDLTIAGTKLMQYVIGLEQSGYRVGLTAFWGTYNDGDVAIIGVKVKDPSQPLDITRCAYPFVNPSFHRGICYGWYQRTEGFNHDWGYGHVPRHGSSYHRDIQKSLGAENGIVIYFQDIINDGEQAIEEAIQMECPEALRKA